MRFCSAFLKRWNIAETLTHSLLDAVESGLEKISILLLGKGTDPNGDGRPPNPILYSAMHNEIIFRQLLNAGADPNATGDEDESILMEETAENSASPNAVGLWG